MAYEKNSLVLLTVGATQEYYQDCTSERHQTSGVFAKDNQFANLSVLLSRCYTIQI
jgi:hypothetical protein